MPTLPSGIGLLAVGPTAWSGWAEWSEAGPREQRVGRPGAGVGLGLAGAAISGVGAYLGGHLSAAPCVC